MLIILFSAFENLPELSSKRIHHDLESFSFIPEKKQCSEPFSEYSDTFVKSTFEAANIQRSPLSPIQLPQSQQTGMIADIPSALSLAKLNNEQVDNSKIIIDTVCHLFNLICSPELNHRRCAAYTVHILIVLLSLFVKVEKQWLQELENFSEWDWEKIEINVFVAFLTSSKHMLKKIILFIFVYSTTMYV